MNYHIIEEKARIILKDIRDFDPKDIFECGQAFRWNLEEDNSYTIVAFNRVLNVKKKMETSYYPIPTWRILILSGITTSI